MKKSRRLAVALAVSGLVAASAVAASQLAHADVAGTCKAPGADANCNVTETITSPTGISITVSVTPAKQYPTYNYNLQCSLGAQSTTTTGNGAAQTPYTVVIPLPFANPDSCTISVNAVMPSANVHNELSLEVDFTTGPVSVPTPPPTSGTVHMIKGSGGKCLDARGNSSANRTAVIVWTCNNADHAQGWNYFAGHLIHNGKCANDAGNGGSGTKVILWTCNRSSNELWFHSSTLGEYILASTTHGLLCLTAPSTRSGTQLIVSACRNTSSQHWST